jgi:flagellar export protein FliJ
MKRFNFSLQAVQTVRERAARNALELYARALRDATEAERNLELAEKALKQQVEDWRRAMKKSFAPSEMLQHEHARTMLEARRAERAQQLREANNAVVEAQSAFQMARQKCDVVERFHDRQKREFSLAALKEEQHLLDEMAAARHEPRIFEKGLAHA